MFALHRWLLRRIVDGVAGGAAGPDGAERAARRAVIGPMVLAAMVSVLYLVFVITLFAGFSADIQREMLSRELKVGSPGELERIVLEGFHEAELKDDLRDLRRRIRVLDAQALDGVQHEMALRSELIEAWRDAFEQYAGLGNLIAAGPDRFDPAFRAKYLSALKAAYDFLARSNFTDFHNFQGSASQGDTTQEDASAPASKRDGVAKETAAQNAREISAIVQRLDAALAGMTFAPDATDAFRTEAKSKAADIEAAMIRFGEVRGRISVEWTNLAIETVRHNKLRQSLTAEAKDLEAELDRLTGSAGAERWSLVALFQQPVGGVLSVLIQMPAIMLTLLVTLAAGGLGAVVAFTRQYRHLGTAASGLSPEAEVAPASDFAKASALTNMGRLLVTISEGIAAAIAIFLCAEAGMLMMAQGAEASSAIEISPYLVTFMAFVSGFMAEDAFNRIQDAGRKLFKVGTSQADPAGPAPEGAGRVQGRLSPAPGGPEDAASDQPTVPAPVDEGAPPVKGAPDPGNPSATGG